MKRKQPKSKRSLSQLSVETLETIRGGNSVRYDDTSARGDDDDPNGTIIIIGRDGP